jgi:hypothetical protein
MEGNSEIQKWKPCIIRGRSRGATGETKGLALAPPGPRLSKLELGSYRPPQSTDRALTYTAHHVTSAPLSLHPMKGCTPWRAHMGLRVLRHHNWVRP